MKTTQFFLPLLLFLTLSLQAQINVGPDKVPKLSKGAFEPGMLNKLSESKTLFVMRPADEPQKEQLEALFKEVWTITDLELITVEEFTELPLTGATDISILAIEGYSTTVQMSTTSYSNTHYFLRLWMPGEEIPYSEKELKKMERKGERPSPQFAEHTFARIELYPSGEAVIFEEAQRRKSLMGGEDLANDLLQYLWNDAVFYNWKYGYLKNALQEVNRLLKAEEPRWLFQYSKDEPKLRKLQRKTLYVSDNILIKYNKFNGDESKRHEAEDLFSGYDYRYKIIPDDELNQMILEATESFYYFQYIRSSTDAYYTIVDGFTGEIIYSQYDAVTYNIKPKNINEISSVIKKAK